MNDYDFWQQIRRAAITIARAVFKRYGSAGLLILLGIDKEERKET